MHLILLILTLLFQEGGFSITSPAFANKHYIQPKYTCLGENINPPVSFVKVPAQTKSLALIMIDNDESLGNFDHWIVWNIPPSTKSISENHTPGIAGINGNNENKYTGPCPPNGIHEYVFTVYALSTELKLPSATGSKELLEAMDGHIISSASISGMFTKAVNTITK